MQRALALAISLSAFGCGGSSDGPTGGPDEPQGTSYAGVYQTQVTLVTNSCGPVTIQDNPTTVSHTIASGAVSFSHAGSRYTGTVGSNGSFTTTPRFIDVGDGFTYSIALSGQFGSRTFEADATVDRSGSGAPCQYVVHWIGNR